MTTKKLQRSTDDKMIAGVCGGLAEFFGLSSSIIRLVFVVLLFAYGGSLIAYIILWVVMPKPMTAKTSKVSSEPPPKKDSDPTGS